MLSRWRKVLSIFWLALCMAAISLACWHSGTTPHSKATHVFREITFEPKNINLGHVLPGKYPFRLRVHNTSNKVLRDVQILTSCACLVSKEDSHWAEMAVNESRDIFFTINVAGEGEDRQFLTVASPDLNFQFIASITADVFSPLPSLSKSISLPPLIRSTAGVKTTPIVWKSAVVPEARALSMTCAAPWLHTLSHQDANGLAVTVQADAFAPEGAFTVPAELLYTSEAGQQSMSIALQGTLVSRIRVEPGLLSFGMLSVSTAIPTQTCVVQTETLSSLPVSVRCEDKRILIQRITQSVHEVRFQVGIQPAVAGEIRSVIEVKQANQVLATVPVTAFLQR